ncbi:unnamed protein product [Gongylonema pulchrum]|uniref:Uncharacterized protein n=1 Tax=Gongylonema pulchrum TaxID=637853 RepID=A0A183E7N6_9BILA|nr:unnamed protein product [Gongylonema pulchrum]
MEKYEEYMELLGDIKQPKCVDCSNDMSGFAARAKRSLLSNSIYKADQQCYPCSPYELSQNYLPSQGYDGFDDGEAEVSRGKESRNSFETDFESKQELGNNENDRDLMNKIHFA